MNRRLFLAALLSSSSAFTKTDGRPVRLTVDPSRPLGSIPRDFIGLGYEISSVATEGLLSARNQTYVRLVRALSPHGVIRIGGNTSDYASFSPHDRPVSSPKSTIVNEPNLRDLGAFLDATGWSLIWGLNLGHGAEKDAVAEAVAIAAAAKDKLLAFEIGNEPDLFGHGMAHRPKNYSYQDYLAEFRRFKSAIRRVLPDAPFAGPDVASATDWVSQFASDEGRDLKLLTHHYYRECASPTSTLDKLLYPDPKLQPILAKLNAASASTHVPYRICETNSFCGGGKPGVSDTFGSALWVLDFLFLLASFNAAGVNIETGVNQLGFISSYSPLGDDQHGAYSPTPEYYGMLAFAQASQGQRIALDYDAAGLNLTAYAVSSGPTALTITIINKDASHDAHAVIASPLPLSHASAARLTAPSLQSKTGVALAQESLKTKRHECEIHIPAASAAIVKLQS